MTIQSINEGILHVLEKKNELRKISRTLVDAYENMGLSDKLDANTVLALERTAMESKKYQDLLYQLNLYARGFQKELRDAGFSTDAAKAIANIDCLETSYFVN